MKAPEALRVAILLSKIINRKHRITYKTNFAVKSLQVKQRQHCLLRSCVIRPMVPLQIVFASLMVPSETPIFH